MLLAVQLGADDDPPFVFRFFLPAASSTTPIVRNSKRERSLRRQKASPATGMMDAPEVFGDLTVKVVRGVDLQVC